MPTISALPAAACQIVQADARDLDNVNQAIASMMLTLRAGRHFSIEPGLVQWTDEHGNQAGFTCDGMVWDAIPTALPPGLHPTLPDGDDASSFQNRIDHLLQASLSGWAIRGGYRPDPQGKGQIGFITGIASATATCPGWKLTPTATSLIGTTGRNLTCPQPRHPTQTAIQTTETSCSGRTGYAEGERRYTVGRRPFASALR